VSGDPDARRMRQSTSTRIQIGALFSGHARQPLTTNGRQY